MSKIRIKDLVLLVIIVLFSFPIIYLFPTNVSNESYKIRNIHTSADISNTTQWIKNPYFDSSDYWNFIKGDLGDPTDVDAYIDSGMANYEVLGDSGTYTLVADPPQSSDWTIMTNPEHPAMPEWPWDNPSPSYGFDAFGCWANHSWREGPKQSPSVHWVKNITMPIDMSSYVIKSARTTAMINASVNSNIDVETDSPTQGVEFDFVKFYIKIGRVDDLDRTDYYTLASYKTTTLGQNSPSILTLPDTLLNEIAEETLIFYLTSVLSGDGYNFTIIIGMDIFCEDNEPTDYDYWDMLRIKNFNLTFSYEKKINQFTSISWNQNGDKISDKITISNYTSFEVTEAILNFKYKINDTWSSFSPNSEIRILMNNIQHTESIKLSTATTYFQNAKEDGFDITSLISNDVNLSIQFFLADEFELNQTIRISIDDISLNISYTIFFDDYQTQLKLFLNEADKTSTPSIELPIDRILNITIKYANQSGGHIPKADVLLTGSGIIENLTENSNQYSLEINATEQLNMGINYLTIEAKKTNYETRQISVTVTVRKIKTEISTLSGESTINVASGEDLHLQIILNDTDNNELIKGAIVTYIWDLDSVPKVLIEDNGVYEGIIQNPSDGLYTITISVFAGDDYLFEDYEIMLNVGVYVPPEPTPDVTWLIPILIYGFIGSILVVGIIFTVYIKIWRFPPLVRKVRKLRKKISKAKKTKPFLVNNRETLIKNHFQEHIKVLDLEQFQKENLKIIKED